MSFVSAAAVRTAVFVIALSGAGLWALRAMDANADPPPSEDSSPCAEGRALFAAKLAYVAIAPSLTTAQRDIISRNIAPSTPFPGPFPPPVPGPGLPPRPGDLALNCGPGGPGSHGWTAPWGPAPF
jgi:hypothetical protein